jgi:hypothetical protein
MIYYGDEIGLTYGDSKNRTSCLSTMSFYGSKYSGFSNSKKIIPPLTLNRKTNTVEIQNKKSDSLLNHYRKVIELRHSYNVFANGFRKKHKQIDPKIYSYLLYNDEITVLVLHNLSDKPKDLVFNLENILPKENFSLKKILGDKLTSYKLEDKTLYLKKFKGHESLVFEITGITSKNFKEIEPDFDKAEAIKINEKYITQNTNAVYKLPTSNKFLGLKIKASSPHVLTFYNTLSDIIKTNHYIRNIVEINAVDKEIIIPLAFDASFFVFYMEGIEFELVELDMDDYFVKKTKEILKHDSNKTLKSFAYGSDNNFWYFKIQKNSLAMNPNSGLDFCMLINEPSKRKNTSPKKVGFWMLKNIQTKLPINNILIYQQDVGLKKPILYTNTTEASLPGVQHDLAIIFQENKNAFYIVMNKEALPLETYKIGLCVWSAGGAWGDRMPKQYPIVEMLPYNKKEMKKSNPNKLNLVKISDHARINKK